MSNSVDVMTTVEATICSVCGMTFGLPAHYKAKRREDHATWYCPNGHAQYFPAKTEADTLREQLAAERRHLSWARERAAGEQRRAEHAERRLAATRGVVTKMRKRVGNGTCPCCNRHFTNLERHMQSKHPEFGSVGSHAQDGDAS